MRIGIIRRAHMRKVRVVLASGSPRRRELLMQVGLEPVIVLSHVEEVIKSQEPAQVVRELSLQKAVDVAGRIENGYFDEERREEHLENAVVIGADTVVTVDGRILGKPGTRAEAEAMIRLLQNREHQVYTGVAMIFGDTGEKVVFAEKTNVFVYPMSEEQIHRYVDTGESMDKAGAYGIQGTFAAYIRGIEGDYNNVVGLPIGQVCQELMARGFKVF